MRFKFPSTDKYIREDDVLIQADKNSREGIFIPDLITENVNFKSALKTRIHVLPYMLGCMIEAKKSAAGIKRNSKSGKTQISPEDLSAMEAYAKSIGISGIGYARVDSSMIFKDEYILFENAVVLTVEMRKTKIDTAPSRAAIKEIFRTYYSLGRAVNKISKFLQRKGYNAQASSPLSGKVSFVPLAQKAGLGAVGRHGLLISDSAFGPSLRLAAVLTGIKNLPFAKDNPHMWIRDFCKTCGRCIKACPADAIYEKAKQVGGSGELQSIDYEKCAVPFTNDYGCTLCIKNCSFYKGEYQKIKEAYEKKQH